MNKCKLNSLIIALVLILPCLAFALPGAHDSTSGRGYTCNSCHIAPASYGNTDATYTTNVCLRCHSSSGAVTNKAVNQFAVGDFSNIYNTSALDQQLNPKHTSHKWLGSDTNPAAGAIPPTDTAINGLNKNSYFKGSLFCARCHNVHGTSGNDSNFAPYLRSPNDADQLCTNCHRPRDTKNHTKGTHPVNVGYSTAYKANTAGFLANPITNSINPTGEVKLKNGLVVCSSCHRTHNADSRTSTFDPYSSTQTFGQLSTSKGYILRVDAKGKAANDVNICTNCHTGKFAHNGNNQNIQCNDCHGAHVEYDAAYPGELKNVYLVRRYNTYSAATGGFDNKRVLFRYTSASKREYYNSAAVKTGVCQGCHNPTSSHFTNGVEAQGLIPSRVACASCHKHNDTAGSFKASGCDGCHGFPPVADSVGGPNGKASALYTGTESTAPHSTHASGGTGSYSFACAQCHNGYETKHQDGIFNDGVFVSKVAVTPGGILAGATATYTVANTYTSGTCSAVYCHSDGTSTSAVGPVTPIAWANGLNTITTCDKCHALSPTTGAHTKHTAAPLSYGCKMCHSTTVTNNTTVDIAGGKHVNAVKDVSFSGTAPVISGTSCATVACHSDGKGTPAPITPSWAAGNASGACNGCHYTRTSAPALASGSHTTHFALTSGTTNAICINCHTYNGELVAPHIDGTINVTSGCTVCHADPYSTAPGNAPTWGTSASGCAACHNGVGAFTGIGSAPATGSHNAHMDTNKVANAACNQCHAATVANSAGGTYHTDGDIDVTPGGYPANVTKHAAGTYTGRCSTSTCHANPYSAAGYITSPTWGVTAGCAACHTGSGALTGTGFGPATGSHNAHMAALADCADCHSGAVANSKGGSGHLDGNIDVTSGYPVNVAKHAAGSYTGRCSAASCHSNPYSVSGYITSPTWGLTTGCASCHTGAGAFTGTGSGPATGSHNLHMALAASACNQCHAGAVANSAGGSFHPDGDIDVTGGYPANITKHASTTYGATAKCSTAQCHGSTSPVWGVNTSFNMCTKCHGTQTVAAVIDDTNVVKVAPVGGTSTGTGQVSDNTKVGAHLTHINLLNGFSNYSTATYRCESCHSTLPTSGTHATGSSTPQGSFQKLATRWGAMTIATYSGTCANTYCHNPAGAGGTLNSLNGGTNVMPSWTDATYIGNKTSDAKSTGSCSVCHKVPIDSGFTSSYTHGAMPTAQDCSSCHGHNGDTSGALGKRHMDGKLFGAGNCNSCHDYDTNGSTWTGTRWSGGAWGKTNYGGYPSVSEGSGSHAAHINFIKTRLGIAVVLDPVGQLYGSDAPNGNPAKVCGTCHTNVPANHNMNGATDTTGRLINFGDSAFKIGGSAGTVSMLFGTNFPTQNPKYNGVSGTSSNPVGGISKTCSNLSCHYFTTPLWSQY